MSFFTFNLIGNAIDAYQQATTVTADNIANVGTPGASRQVATIQEAIPISGSPYLPEHLGLPGTRGEGAVVNQIARIHQDSYDGLFRGASSSQYFYTTQQQQLGALQNAFGEPSNGVNTAYSALQTAVSNVAASPTSLAVRQNVLTSAQTFATALNSSSTAIQAQQTTILQQATSVVTKANGLIDQIASLNGQIRSLRAVGDNPNTYLDQRDTAIDGLAQLLQTTTALLANGSSFVSVGGRALVDDAVAYHLAAPAIGTSSNGTPTFVIGFAGDPVPSNPSPVPLGSGQLAGFADVYNKKLVPYAQQLDAFASASVTEINRVTQAGVDLNGNDGTALFSPLGVTAGTVAVAISDPTQLAVGMISTNAGSLTHAMNSANNTVSTVLPIDNNVTLFNPPVSAGVQGTLTIAVDGTTQTYAYDTTTPSADTIADFITHFDLGHFGVSAAFDAGSQRIAFTRDPNNIDSIHRALQGSHAPTASFTITDSLAPAVAVVPPPAQGQPATSLLQALGAAAMSGVPQTAQTAYGSADNGAANALTKLFTQTVGIGALQTTAFAVSGIASSAQTITQPPGTPGAFATVTVGEILTVVNAVGVAQNATVTAVNRNSGTITVNAAGIINVGDAIMTAPTRTLGAAYQTLITQMAIDQKAAITGVATQSSLASNIDHARQSVDGINIDEETQNLLKFQNAYSAAAKTLSIINAMMQTTLGLIAGG